jgi:excinuclease ABC subunit A
LGGDGGGVKACPWARPEGRAQGAPEEIVKQKRSYTGAFLKPVLARRVARKKGIEAAE